MQATLRERLEFDGVGLHTGADCRVCIVPAPPDAGLTFVAGNVRVPALVDNVIDTSRATVIGRDGVSISTTEHLLSALFALGVSNADIVVEGPEIPVCDGSAAVFCERITQTGIATQNSARPTFKLSEPIVVRDGEKLVAAFPAPSLRVRFVADFAEPIGTQYFLRRNRARNIHPGDRGCAHVRLLARSSGAVRTRVGARGQFGKRLSFRARWPPATATLGQRSGAPQDARSDRRSRAPGRLASV